MKQKLKEIREKMLEALNELDELIEGEEKQIQRARPIDPPPEKPPHGN